jgi:protein-S-isoprenylcysteine O-methyltransferase Ste14
MATPISFPGRVSGDSMSTWRRITRLTVSLLLLVGVISFWSDTTGITHASTGSGCQRPGIRTHSRSNVQGLPAAPPASAPRAYGCLCKVVERELFGVFGDHYREYASHTGRYLPRLLRDR